MTGRSGTGASPRRRAPRLVACSALALLLGLVTACSDDEPAGSAQRVLPGTDTTTVEGDGFTVVVPNGVYEFTVGDRVDDLPDDVERSGGRAVDGASYVGIAWRPVGEAPELGPVLRGTDPEVATVTVQQGPDADALTTLGPAADGGSANGVAWVAVTGDEPTLAVEYDGLTQTFDLATGERERGPADGFYDATPPLRGTCRDRGPGRSGSGLQYTVTCNLSAVASVPYVAGRGWVPDGETTFLVGDLELAPSTFRRPFAGGSAPYRVEEATTSVTIAGDEVTPDDATETPSGGWRGTFVGQAPRSEGVTLEVARQLALVRDDTSAPVPARDEVDLSYSVELE